jgi:pimeloyl-ACP methyl ester carboxylesterase
MRTELITITTDTTPIDGAYYTPDSANASGGVLLMHGNTMNFYVGAPRFLPPYLTALGYSCLAFNRRGHDILGTRDSRAPEGGAFQTAAEGMADNDRAALWLAQQGFPQPVVIAHSNGGMLGAQFAADHPETRALVLLSAHGGGRDARRYTGKGSQFLAREQSEETLEHAHRLVEAGHGRVLLMVPGWWYVISAESYVDRMLNCPDTVQNASRIGCPSLFVRGDHESPEVYPAERFHEVAGGPCEVAIIEDCDHFYVGREEAVARIVADWLVRTLSG